MLCAGLYKGLAGYWSGRGMDLGLANPMWSYHHGFFSRMKPRGIFMTALNRSAVVAETACGLLLVLGTVFANRPAMIAGALGITATFALLLPFVRLGRLAALMCMLPVIYAPAFDSAYGGALDPGNALALWALAYALALPWVKVIQYANYFTAFRLPGPLQRLFNRFCNGVPIVLWRVFTDDVVSFYVQIDAAQGDAWLPLNHGQKRGLRERLRFSHLTENIAITSLFTTLKYHPGDDALFKTKMREYSRTLRDHGEGTLFRFDVVGLEQGADRYAPRRRTRYIVNADTGGISTEQLH
jgi:hypothetical protein